MRLVFLFAIVLFFASCSDKVKMSGIVIDKESGKPLDSVAVTRLDEVMSNGYNWISTYTHNNGRFTISCSSEELKQKSRLPLIFQKQGYGSVVEFYSRITDSDTVYLEKK